MKNVKMKTYLILFLAAITLLACKKEEEPEDQQNTIEEPTLVVETVDPPATMSNSQDIGAQQSVTYITLANAFAGLAGAMTPPASNYKNGLDDGPPWVYTWDVNDNSGNYTVTLTVDEKGEQGFEWEMSITGTMEGITFSDFVYMRAEQSENGVDGLFEMYDPDTQQLGMYVTWSNTPTVYNVVFEVPEEIKIIINEYPNESGDLEVYEWENAAYVLIFESEWTANSGLWWMYMDGELYDSGGW